MQAPEESDVWLFALAYSWWETYDLVINPESNFNEQFIAWLFSGGSITGSSKRILHCT